MAEIGSRGDIAVDVGGSGVRLAILGENGHRVDLSHRFESRLVDPANAAADFLLSSAARGQLPSSVGSVLVGLSGVFGNVRGAQLPAGFSRFRAEYGCRELLVCDDSTTAFFGALGAQPGVVSAVGTGIVTAAWDGHLGFHRVDGWGHIGGDSGSGYWIGARGARNVLEMEDGRREHSALAQAFRIRYQSPAEFARMTALGNPPKSYVADFAQDILDLAGAGDALACDIVTAAAAQIVRSISSAERRLGLSGELVSITGRVVAPGSYMEATIRRAYKEHGGTGTWIPAIGDPLDGAVRVLQTPRLRDLLNPDHIYRVRW